VTRTPKELTGSPKYIVLGPLRLRASSEFIEAA